MKTIRALALTLLAALSLVLSATPALATHLQQGDHFILSTSPVQFSTSLGMVQSIVFRTIPGYCGKVYIGKSTMNTATLAGVFKVLYPNCSGGIGDEYSLEDRTAADGIDSSVFYIAGDIGGEQISWEAYQTRVTASGTLHLYCSGPAMNYTAFAPYAAPGCATSGGNPVTGVAVYQVAVVPGMSGKVRVGNGSMLNSYSANYSKLRKMLWPNSSGTPKTDFFVAYDPSGGNGVWLPSYSTWADVGGEYPLVTAWQRQ